MATIISPVRSSFKNVQWHPIVTPYRAFVLFSTIGLGSGKAFSSANSLTLVATHVEWIIGVGLFTIIHILGLLERNPPRNRFLSWFLTHDILQIRKEEGYPDSKHKDAENLPGPIMTGYRLLITCSVTLFGVVKAYLVYHDAPSATAVDWISGVVITSCLYVLGLYQDNPVNLLSYLFFADCSYVVNAGSWTTIYLAGLSLSLLWMKITFELTFISSFKPGLHAIYNQLDHSGITSPGNLPLPHTLGRGLGNLSIHFIRTFFWLLYFIVGAIVFLTFIRKLHHIICGFSFTRVSLRILSTHFQLARSILEIIMCLIGLPVCGIVSLALSYLFLDFFFGVFVIRDFWLMHLFMGPVFGFYLVIAISAFICFMTCLYFFVCLISVICSSVSSQEIRMTFHPTQESIDRPNFWSYYFN